MGTFLVLLLALHYPKIVDLIGSSGRIQTYNRLTASEFVGPPAAIDCYKPLYEMHLSSSSNPRIDIRWAP
jgi:hypothetical protein